MGTQRCDDPPVSVMRGGGITPKDYLEVAGENRATV